MKILLLGVGFIGTNFYKLFKDKYEIVLVDNFSYPCTLENGLWDMEKPLPYRRDIKDIKEIVDIEKPDYIVNTAAHSHVDVSISGESFFPTNVLGVENILRAIKGTNIKLVQFSTDEVYGDTEVDSTYEFIESDKLNPSSPYSASKASAEMVVNAYKRTYGVNAVIVRPTNNYGPYQYPEKLIPFQLKRVSEGKKVAIYGDGKNIREWLYVEDCCRAVELVMREGEGIYNIGSGERLSNNDIAKFIGEAEYIEDRKGHDRRYAVNSERIRSLGWKPKVYFKRGIELTKNWYEDRMLIIKGLSANSHVL